MSDWQPHEGEHVIADIPAADFPHPAVGGTGTIRVPATVMEISGEAARLHLDAIVVSGQENEVTLPVSVLSEPA